MGPKSLLRDTLDTPWALWGPCWELRGLLGRSVELLGGSLGALGRSLGALRGDFGSILGVFLMDSGAFFGSQARPIMKRCLLGSPSTFLMFLKTLPKLWRSLPLEKTMNLQLFCVMLEALVSLFLSLYSSVFLEVLRFVSLFLACFCVVFALF